MPPDVPFPKLPKPGSLIFDRTVRIKEVQALIKNGAQNRVQLDRQLVSLRSELKPYQDWNARGKALADLPPSPAKDVEKKALMVALCHFFPVEAPPLIRAEEERKARGVIRQAEEHKLATERRASSDRIPVFERGYKKGILLVLLQLQAEEAAFSASLRKTLEWVTDPRSELRRPELHEVAAKIQTNLDYIRSLIPKVAELSKAPPHALFTEYRAKIRAEAFTEAAALVAGWPIPIPRDPNRNPNMANPTPAADLGTELAEALTRLAKPIPSHPPFPA